MRIDFFSLLFCHRVTTNIVSYLHDATLLRPSVALLKSVKAAANCTFDIANERAPAQPCELGW